MFARLFVIAGLGFLLMPSPAGATRLLGNPTISSTEIAFEYGNDLWVVGRDGGAARRLTSFPGTEASPYFSPDGRWIAFTANYGGNDDVYVAGAAGGEPRRLTWHPGSDRVRGWTPDGTKVLFASGRNGATSGSPQLWTIPATGGLETPLPMETAAEGAFSPDGRRIAYQHIERVQREWRNYRGGQAQPLWILDLDSHEVVKIPGPVCTNDAPVWLGNTIYFLSDRDLARNVHAYDIATGEVRQLTHHKDFDVAALGGGGGALVYEQAGLLHRLDPATGESRPLDITAAGDFSWAMPHPVELGKQLAHGSLSRTGQRALFEARGEIVTIPVEKGDPRLITRSPGAADRSPAWSPEGDRIAWFSDAGGEYRLMIGAANGTGQPREIALEHPTFYYDLTWSPDGKRLAFTDSGRTLWVVEVATGRATRVDGDTYAHPERTLVPAWSPDSKFIAYTKRLSTQFLAIMIWSVADGRAHQVTDGMSDTRSPAWDAGGKYLWFLASTDFGPGTGWLSMTSLGWRPRYGLYLAVLDKSAPSPLLPESDEEKGEEQPAGKDDSAARKGSGKKGAAAGDSAAVHIDFDGLQQRVVSADIPLRRYRTLKAGVAGVLFLAEAVEDQPDRAVRRYDMAKRAVTPFLDGVQGFALSGDGKKLLYQTREAWGVVAADGEPKPGDGRLKTDVSALTDPRAEWRQIFVEAWRFERDYLYVRNLHGADWNLVRQMYEPMLDDVVHRSDLSRLLVLLGGELSIGHSFVFGGDAPEVKPEAVGLLGADVVEANGRYRLARLYGGESWNPELRAPLRAPGVRAAQGDYILQVDGLDVHPPDNFHRHFIGKQDRQTLLRLNSKPTLDGSWTVTVVPVGLEAEFGLRTARWVEDNRRLVDSLSAGRLAYVWLPNTGNEGYSYFNRYYFAQQDRPGVIVDERYNGGGKVADYFIDIMKRPLYGFFNNPVGDRRPWTSPEAGIWGPKVMIANESAGSGGDMLPYMFKQQQVGTLVGTRTWGGLVGIWDVPALVDGGIITAPRGGFFNRDGEWEVENAGVPPDIEVEQLPKETMAGHDPQLERAVAEALRQLATWQSPLRPEPPPPVRAKRP